MATAEKKKGKKGLKRFRLRRGVGTHYEPNPNFDRDLPEEPGNWREIKYEAGDVVVSPRDLDKIFVNKFTPYDKMAKDVQAEQDEDLAADRENEAALEETRKAAKESEELGKRAKKEGIVTKEKGHGDDQDEEPEPVYGEDDEDVSAEDSDEEESEEEEDEEDVSSDFKKAADADLVVKKQGGHFYVYEKGEDEPMKGSKKGFTNKKDANKFISSQIITE